jgi:hypothetical protein
MEDAEAQGCPVQLCLVSDRVPELPSRQRLRAIASVKKKITKKKTNTTTKEKKKKHQFSLNYTY